MWNSLKIASVVLLLASLVGIGFAGGRLYEWRRISPQLKKAENAYKYTREQLEYATKAVRMAPSIRVGKINSRYHDLMKKHGIDPEKEGVYDK